MEQGLPQIRSAIAAACTAAGRAPESVRLLAVAKTRSADEIAPLIDAGITDFGENYVQEAAAKWPALKQAHRQIRLHLVGALQSNKAKAAVQLFDVISSVDRPSLVASLAKASVATGRRPQLRLEVNLGGESQKAGVAPAGIPSLLAACTAAGLTVEGLMTIPPADADPRPYFQILARLATEFGLPEISMGMSADYATAIACGATEVRIGTALFGARDKKEPLITTSPCA